MKFAATENSKEKLPIVGLGMGKGIGQGAKTASYGEKDAKLLQLGIDLGMTFIDLASDYGTGRAEEIAGRALIGIRNKAFIATKFAPKNSGYADVIRSAENSLRRLNTDRIDLFQSHWPNPQVPFEETLAALRKLVDDGKVRYIGFSNCTLNEIDLAKQLDPSIPLLSIQQEYNLLDQTAEKQFIPCCRQKEMVFIGYSPLAHLRANQDDPKKVQLARIAEKYALSASQLTLCYLTREPGVMVVTRTSNEKHLIENSKVLDFELPEECISAVATIFNNEVMDIPASKISIHGDSASKVYATIDEAMGNIYHLNPSPEELSRQIRSGENLKPIKISIRRSEKDGPPYEVVEGKLRYWAWIIAYGADASIPSLIVN